jgi:hypothetical protein
MPSFDHAPIRAAIKAKIAAVANVGQVHNRERYAKTASDVLNLYKSNAQAGDRILGWFVSLRSKREWSTEFGQRWYADCRWKVVGYMSLDDADQTEVKLATLTDTIGDAFRADDNLGGAVFSMIDENAGAESGLQVRELDNVLFAGVLCHRAQCELFTRSIF